MLNSALYPSSSGVNEGSMMKFEADKWTKPIDQARIRHDVRLITYGEPI